MRWNWVLGLSAFGLVTGAASVFGWIEDTEPVVWLVYWLAAAVLLGWNVPSKPFFHGAIVGALTAIVHSVLQMLFFDAYLAHSAAAAKELTGISSNASPREYFLLRALAIAAFSAIFLGLFTSAAAKFHRVFGKQAPPAPRAG